MIKLQEVPHQFDLELTSPQGIVQNYKGFEPTFIQYKELMAIEDVAMQAEQLVKVIWPSLVLDTLPLSVVQQLLKQVGHLLEENTKKN